MNKIFRNHFAFFLFVVPALVMYATFYILPLLNSLQYSVTSWNGINEPVYNGFDNFAKALSDEQFWIALKNNIYFVLFSVFIQVPVIVIISILVSGVRRLLEFYKVTVYLPSILSTAAVAVIWQFVYQPDAGLMNQILKVLGLESLTRLWLGDPDTSMLAILVTNAWQWTGFYIVLVLAAIFAVPREILEAGTMDGAVGWRKAWLLTIPLIRPVIIVVMLLSITGAMKALDIVLIMTNGGPFGSSEVMATYMYKQAYSYSDFGYANAISIIICVFTAIISLIFHLLTRRRKGADEV
ncbi:sugar ABC transporter permease [Paenibacillus selenitireducens]|jgi:raffinose/stachyose/melibiose transport system permease protein|uniref:Sugar ABC transporter permease n=1 Tax=Paenibacillus selenitireducens TaxID=1324314 RepID=A0A1T2X8A9_9BACL|nr:sugar ABC transporter permease [Paenibacillus selenitireducens]OPA76065.1 sugar ABC transporter permease [Paenibacillus selenitireducens]